MATPEYAEIPESVENHEAANVPKVALPDVPLGDDGGLAGSEGLDHPERPPVSEDQVRARIVEACHLLATLRNRPEDEAKDWELAIAVPGATRMINNFPVLRNLIEIDDAIGDKVPDWFGLFLMIVTRAVPGAFKRLARLLPFGKKEDQNDQIR